MEELASLTLKTYVKTQIDFLLQTLRKLWGIEYLAHLAQTVIIFFA